MKNIKMKKKEIVSLLIFLSQPFLFCCVQKVTYYLCILILSTARILSLSHKILFSIITINDKICISSSFPNSKTIE